MNSVKYIGLDVHQATISGGWPTLWGEGVGRVAHLKMRESALSFHFEAAALPTAYGE